MFKKSLYLLCFSLFILGCSEEKHQLSVDKETRLMVSELKSSTRLLFRYQVNNPSGLILKNSAIFIALPLNLSARHKRTQLEVNTDYKIISDLNGNQTIKILFPEFAPFATKLVTIKTTLTLQNTSLVTLPSLLPESQLVPYQHEKIQLIASKFKALPIKAQVTRSYQWVVDHMQYAGYLPDDRGALYALNTGRGDCTEYMFLLAALLRANKIPSRLVAGYVYPQSRLVDAADYHNWVEVFIDGQWLIVDAQKEQLLVDNSDYITMRYLDSTDSLIKQSQRFLVSDDLNVKMY